MNSRIRAALAALVLTVSTVVAAPAAAAAQTLNWTADDNITRYKSAPTTAVAGATTIVWENSAATGNTTGMPHTLTFDTQTPGFNHDVTINILASPFDEVNGRHTANVTLTAGRYRYFCSIPGHSTMVGEFTVTTGGGEDTTPPTVTGAVSGTQNSDGDYVGSAILTVTATDDSSGVAGVEYEVDDTGFHPYTAPVTVSAVGDHSVQFRATDNAGNTSETGSVTFRVVEPGQQDTTPPTVASTVTGDKDANGNFIGTATVTLTATDDGSGVAGIEYNVDGGAFQAYSAPVVVSGTGSHMVHYRATDNAGNTSPEQMAMFTIVAPPEQDTTPPSVTAAVTGDRDPDGDYIGTATVTLTATDAGSGVDLVEYAVDSGDWAAYPASGGIVVGALGAHTVKYRATDKAGNTSAEGTTSFTVVAPPEPDTTAPATSATVTGDRDADGAYLGAATVSITATDAESGVRQIQFSLDSGAWTTYAAPVIVRTVGDHTLGYRATDNAGNTSAEDSVTFTVAPSGEDACPASDTRATVIIRDDDTGVANKDSGDGCTINDLIDEYGDYPTHAAFVRHVEAVTAPLAAAGTITKRQQGAIVRAAARSGVGS